MLLSNPGCRWLVMNVLTCYNSRTSLSIKCVYKGLIDPQSHFKERRYISDIFGKICRSFVPPNGKIHSCKHCLVRVIELVFPEIIQPQSSLPKKKIIILSAFDSEERSHLFYIVATVMQDSCQNMFINSSSKQANRIMFERFAASNLYI